MEILKAGFVIAAALGSTWAAREATNSFFGASQGQALVQAAQTEPQTGSSGENAPPAEPPAARQSTSPVFPEISRQEMEEELKRAEAEISGKPGVRDMDEFRPNKPLAADAAISLPSDI